MAPRRPTPAHRVLLGRHFERRFRYGSTDLDVGVLDHAGVLNVNTGWLRRPSNSPVLAGQYNLAANSSLDITNGVVTGIITAAAGSAVALDGRAFVYMIIAPGGVLDGPGEYSISGRHLQYRCRDPGSPARGLVLDGPANVTVTGELDWTGGEFNDPSGTLTLPAGALLDISGNYGKTFNGRTVNLAGRAAWTDGGAIGFGGSPLNVLPTGAFHDRERSAHQWRMASSIISGPSRRPTTPPPAAAWGPRRSGSP